MKAFLSHSSVDKHYVDAVAHRLGRARVEYDTMSFEPMVDFRDAIRAALGRSEVLVLFASRASLSSYWVRYEIDRADELVKQGQLRSAVALIIDDATSISDLPYWMRQARVERVRQPTRAARLISQHLHRLLGLDDQPLYIGRERAMAEFSRVVIGRPDAAPTRTIIVHGLPGTGRRTFLQHAFKNFLSLEVGPVLTLEPTDDLETLHARLVDELGELDTRDQLSRAMERFRASRPAEKTEELGRLIAGVADRNSAPVIVDNGALLQADGQYLPPVLDLLAVIPSYKDLHLAIVHPRKPVIDRDRLTALQALQFRIAPIDRQATALLMSQSLRRTGITATLEDVNELASYMDGYPPAVYLATSLIKEYGVSTIVADKSTLIDFKIRAFSQVLRRLDLTDADWQCLRVLASEPMLPLEALAAALRVTPTDMAMEVRRLIDLSVVTPHDYLFQIAPPVREAVFVVRGVLSDQEFASIATGLQSVFWQNPDELPPMDVISATVHAISRSDIAQLTKFGNLVLPSTLFKAAKEKYEEGGPDAWDAAKKLTEHVLQMDKNHRRARILRFKLLVRLSDWAEAQKQFKEIAATGDTEQYYLRGFMQWKQRQYDDAIMSFRNALRAGHTATQVYHGLATCQFRRGWTEEALVTINDGLKGRSRPNKFLLDLGVQAAVEAGHYAQASSYLESLKRIKEDADYHHRAATVLSAQGRLQEAIVHAELAAQQARARFEVLAHRANILIELGDFDRAVSELNDLDTRFRADRRTHDPRIGLRCKLLLREQKWPIAEQVLRDISDRSTPQYRALRSDILSQKVKDPSVSPGEREAALTEKAAIEVERLRRDFVEEIDGAEADDDDTESESDESV
jgi:tetratricopeptide (TPR) repeat protein